MRENESQSQRDEENEEMYEMKKKALMDYSA